MFVDLSRTASIAASSEMKTWQWTLYIIVKSSLTMCLSSLVLRFWGCYPGPHFGNEMRPYSVSILSFYLLNMGVWANGSNPITKVLFPLFDILFLDLWALERTLWSLNSTVFLGESSKQWSKLLRFYSMTSAHFNIYIT